jgi:hypothetical protein
MPNVPQHLLPQEVEEGAEEKAKEKKKENRRAVRKVVKEKEYATSSTQEDATGLIAHKPSDMTPGQGKRRRN